MRLFAISMSLLMISMTVNVASSQETKSKQKSRPATNVAGTQDTDPGDPIGLSEGLDNVAVGTIFPGNNPAGDPAETGKRMVMQGMSIQINVLAAAVRAAEDADVRKSKMAELRETVGVVVELRKKYLQERIARLEKLVATLRQEVEKEDSVDEMVKQLLTRPAPSTEPGAGPRDPAENPAGGTDTDTAATDPGNVSNDPAEKKKDKDKGTDNDKDKANDKAKDKDKDV